MLKMITEDAQQGNALIPILFKVGALLSMHTSGWLRGYEDFYLDLMATQNHRSKTEWINPYRLEEELPIYNN